MKIKRTVGRFVLIRNNELKFPMAFYIKDYDKIVICFGNSDCISASQEINKLMKEQMFLNKCMAM